MSATASEEDNGIQEITSEVSIWPLHDFAVTLDDLADDTLNQALGRYLRDAAFNSYTYCHVSCCFEPSYLLENFSDYVPYRVYAYCIKGERLPEDLKDFEGMIAEEMRRHWENNYFASPGYRGGKNPEAVKAILKSRKLTVDVFDYGDDVAVMRLPYNWKGWKSKERLVCPIITNGENLHAEKPALLAHPPDSEELYSKDELSVMHKIVGKVDGGIESLSPGKLSIHQVSHSLYPEEPRKCLGHPPYTVASDCTPYVRGLYVVCEMDIEEVTSFGVDPQTYEGGLILGYVDDVANAAKTIKTFLKEKHEFLDSIAQKYVDKVTGY